MNKAKHNQYLKAIVILFICLLFSQTNTAQTFNKIYLPNDSVNYLNFGGFKFNAFNKSYYGGFFASYQNSKYQKTGIAQFDEFGNLTKLNNQHRDSITGNLILGPISEFNNRIYSTSIILDTNYFKLSIFNKNSIELKKDVFVEFFSNHFSLSFIEMIRPNKYIIGGRYYPKFITNHDAAFISIIDSTGQILKTEIFDTPLRSDAFHDIYIDKNQNIWVSGKYYEVYVSDKNSNNTDFIIKYDSSLNQIDKLKFDATIRRGGIRNIKFTDSSFYFTTALGVKKIENVGFDLQFGRLVEYDLRGNVLWEYVDSLNIHRDIFNEIARVKLDTNGNLFALGYALAMHDSASQFGGSSDSSTWDYHLQTILYKWNKNRELVWKRHIKHPSAKGNWSECSPADFDILPDNSILISGRYKASNKDKNAQTTHGWLVRTDSNGCIDGQQCINWRSLSIQDVVKTKTTKQLTVYPNPTTTGNISVKQTFGQNHLARVYTLSGKMVYMEQFKNKQFTLPNSMLNSSYIMLVSDDDKVYQTKFTLIRK